MTSDNKGPIHGSYKIEVNQPTNWPGVHYNRAYGPKHNHTTNLHVNESQDGESIERRVERILNNNEPLTDGAPEIYTERKDGVDPMHNIRTDRFEVALDMTDTITKTALAKRKEFHDNLDKQNNPPPAADNPTGV